MFNYRLCKNYHKKLGLNCAKLTISLARLDKQCYVGQDMLGYARLGFLMQFYYFFGQVGVREFGWVGGELKIQAYRDSMLGLSLAMVDGKTCRRSN